MKTQKQMHDVSTGLKGMTVERYYTVPGIHPFDKIEWERRTASITDMKGTVIFEQTDVETPRSGRRQLLILLCTNIFTERRASRAKPA